MCLNFPKQEGIIQFFLRTLNKRRKFTILQRYTEYFYSPRILQKYKKIRSIEINEMVILYTLNVLLRYNISSISYTFKDYMIKFNKHFQYDPYETVNYIKDHECVVCGRIILPKNIEAHLMGEVCFFFFCHLTLIPTYFEY